MTRNVSMLACLSLVVAFQALHIDAVRMSAQTLMKPGPQSSHPPEALQQAIAAAFHTLALKNDPAPVDPVPDPVPAPADPAPAPADPAPAPSPSILDDFLTRMEQDPSQIFFIILNIYSAYSGALENWGNQEFNEVFDGLKLSLWSAFESAASDTYKASPEFTNAKAAWENGLDQMKAMAPAAHNRFQAGNNTAWSDVWLKGVETVNATMQAGAPSQSADWNVVAAALDGAVTGWSKWQNEKPAEAIAAVWKAVNETVWHTTGVTADSDIGKWLIKIDVVVTGVQTALTTYESNKEDPKMCKKTFYSRESVPVSQCYHGFVFNQESLSCVPTAENGADCQPHCPVGAACTSFCPTTKRYCCKKDDNTLAADHPCKRATFVDLSFTHGSAADYYQCVSPVTAVVSSGNLLQFGNAQEQHSGLVQRMMTASTGAASMGSAALATHARSLDGSVASKWWTGEGSTGAAETTTPVEPSFGSHTPVCDPNAAHGDTIAGYEGSCFAQCNSGYEIAMTAATDNDPAVQTDRCKQSCRAPLTKTGNFGVSGLDIEVCSETDALLDSENNQNIEQLKSGFGAILDAVNKVRANGDLTKVELESTTNAISAMVLQFMIVECTDGGTDEN